MQPWSVPPVGVLYLCLDADENGSGPRAAQLWSRRLGQNGLRLLPVQFQDGGTDVMRRVKGERPRSGDKW